MSNLETKISELERELALKKGYQAVKFILPKSLPDDVKVEIESKLREISEQYALSKEQLTGNTATTAVSVFSDEETSALKLIAASVLKKTTPASAQPTPAVKSDQAFPGSSSIHKPQLHGPARKGKVSVTENIRGEAKRHVAVGDEIFVPNPEKVDEHGMVSATHMKRGSSLRILLEDVEFTD